MFEKYVEMLRMSTFSARIQNLGWIILESTLRYMRVDVEKSSFGYNLISEIWISYGSWDTHPEDEKGFEALSSLGHLNTWTLGHSDTTVGHLRLQKSTRNRPEIIRKQCSWKWNRTLREPCGGIRSHQGWHLTPRDFIKLNFKNSIFSRIPRFW